MGYGNGGTSTGSSVHMGNAVNASGESPSKIRDVIGSHEQQMSELHVDLDSLEKRLDTVLTPQPPTATGADVANAPTPPSSHLYQRTIEHGRGLTYVIQRLRDITRRIEI